MNSRDVIVACAALAVALMYYLAAAAIAPSTLDDGIGPAGVPKAYAVLLATLSLVLLVASVARRHQSAHASAAAAPGDGLSWKAGATLLVGAGYVGVVSFIGYVPALALLLSATVLWFGGGFTLRTASIAAGGALGFWIFFVLLLRIPQPAGLWSSLF